MKASVFTKRLLLKEITNEPRTSQILDPQSATLTNIEVLAHLTANPPRRSPNTRNIAPKPDLRDHNTVVKEV